MSSFVSEEPTGSESLVEEEPTELESLVEEELPESLVPEQQTETSSVNKKKQVLLVLDIDESLLQFINKGPYNEKTKKIPYDFWKELSPEDRRVINNRIEYTELPEKKQVILFRPGLEQFLKMAQASGRIKVAIWTYSEREYAEMIAEEICRKFDLPEDTFIFAYGTEDIKDHDVPKSLQQIWSDPRFGSKFNKFNTFLVDDRFGNLSHDINSENSILVQAFAPFGEKKTREAMTPTLLEKAINDHLFSDLTTISKRILEDIDGCDDDDIEAAFTTESVFSPKRVKRMGLSNYVKEYYIEKDDINVKLFTIGNVENARNPNKGGRRTKKRRNYKKTTQIKRGKMMKRGKKSMRKNVKYMKSRKYHRR